MIDRLIDFLDTLSRVPGCRGLLGLRDRLREMQYRQTKSRGAVKGTIGKFRSAQRASVELVSGGRGQAAPGPAMAAADVPAMEDHGASEMRTLLRPRPGGRISTTAALAPVQSAATQPALPAQPIQGSGLNRLVDTGTELLTLAAQLQRTARHDDLRALRIEIAQRIEAFDAAARRAGAPNDQVVPARYALCTLLDEVVLATAWGADSPWAQHSLLSQFHNETWGGEKFFQILDRLLIEPARHLHLLEFIDVCLALGMQGRYRIADGGRSRLLDIRKGLYQSIRRVRGEVPAGLSPHWQGVTPPRARLARLLPLWAVAALGIVMLAAAYAAYSWNLSRQAEPVYAELAGIGRDARLAVPVPAVQRTLSLREVLASDIAAGRLDVIEQARGSTIDIHGDGFFASGSAEIEPALLPVLERIASALNRFDGAVRVTGHTDNQPVSMSRRLRYATNWELSQARAEAVAAVLAKRLDQAARLTAEGRGDAEPKAPNDTAAHRALNRRVEVSLMGAATVAAEAAQPVPAISVKSAS